MKDSFLAPKNNLKKQWYIVDAKDKYLGRICTEVVTLLRGKNKTFFSPTLDTGDYVIIINAKKIKISGKKAIQKNYFRHSGRPGGKTIEKFEDLQLRIPERIIEKAIKGMLPKNRLGRQLFLKLKVYKDQNHPHFSQNPQLLSI